MTDLSFCAGSTHRPRDRGKKLFEVFGLHNGMLSWRRHLVSIFFSILAAGCASDSAENRRDDEFANMTTDERMAMCTRIWKDARVACRDGLQDPQASRSMECLSAQLKLDRYCLTPK